MLPHRSGKKLPAKWSIEMSNDATRLWARMRHEEERRDRGSVADGDGRGMGSGGDACLHCGCPVSASNGTVTKDAAICDRCND